LISLFDNGTWEGEGNESSSIFFKKFENQSQTTSDTTNL
jgi:hypothetical protein